MSPENRITKRAARERIELKLQPPLWELLVASGVMIRGVSYILLFVKSYLFLSTPLSSRDSVSCNTADHRVMSSTMSRADRARFAASQHFHSFCPLMTNPPPPFYSQQPTSHLLPDVWYHSSEEPLEQPALELAIVVPPSRYQ